MSDPGQGGRLGRRGGRERTAIRIGGACGVTALLLAAPFAGGSPSVAIAATTAAATTTIPTSTSKPAPTTTTRPKTKGTTTTVPAPTTTAPVTTTTSRSRTRSTTTTTTPASTTAPGPPGVSLVSQPPWIPTGGNELMALHLDEPALATAPNAEVALTIHSSVSSRTDFDRAVNGLSLGNTLSRITFPFSSISVDRAHDFAIGFGLSGSGASRHVGVDRAGVYPVEVGVIDAAGERSTFVTWMVVVDQSASASAAPLRFSWIWQLGTGPLERADGSIDHSALLAMHPGGRLDHAAMLLQRAGGFPLALGLDPQTLEVWAREATGHPAIASALDRVRRAASRSTAELLPEPYVPIAGPTIEAEGLGTHLPAEYVAGSNAVEQVTGQIPDPRTAFVDPVDDATVSRLTQILVGRFIVRDTALAATPQSLTPAQPFALTTTTGITSPAVATDSGLEQLVDSAGTPALRAQRVVAALAEIAYEAPSLPRGVVLATPELWSPDVQTVTLLLQDLAHDPLVKPVTPATIFSTVSPAGLNGGPLQRLLLPLKGHGSLPLRASEYDNAVRELQAYAGMVGGGDPAVVAGKRSLLLALSTDNTRTDALAHLDTISAKLAVLTSGITTTAKTLTLTARRASLPLSFQNSTGRAGINVLVHLESPKLIFPKGPDFLLKLPIGHTTAKRNEFPVEARASGTFAMTITLESPDGKLVLGAPTSVTIHSDVFSGIGIALTLGALLFLAGWWANHFWRTRRMRRRARVA